MSEFTEFFIYLDELESYGVTGDQLLAIGFTYVAGMGYEIQNFQDDDSDGFPDLLAALMSGDLNIRPSTEHIGG